MLNPVPKSTVHRSGKSTHTSMISNSCYTSVELYQHCNRWLLCAWYYRKFRSIADNATLSAGLEKVLISPWLVTLLHICGVIPTPQSPVTPRDRRRRRTVRWRLCIERRRLRIQRWRLCIERRRLRIQWRRLCIERRRLCIKRWRLHIQRRRLRIERRYRRIEWRLFHDVSQCFKCFMMVY